MNWRLVNKQFLAFFLTSCVEPLIEDNILINRLREIETLLHQFHLQDQFIVVTIYKIVATFVGGLNYASFRS